MTRPRIVPMPAEDGSNNRYSGSVRASIFDSFYQLGGMDQDSQLADWMFNDNGNGNNDLLSTPPSSPPQNFHGSKFTERFDSDSIHHLPAPPRFVNTPPVTFRTEPEPEDRPRRPSKATKLLQRMRSKSRNRNQSKHTDSRHTDLPTPPPESPPAPALPSSAVRSFFRRPPSRREDSSRPSTPPRGWSMFRKPSNEIPPPTTPSTRSSQDTITRSRSPLGIPPNTVLFPTEPFIHRRGRAPSKGSLNLLDNEGWEHMSSLTLPSGANPPNPYIQGELFIPDGSDADQQKWHMRRLGTPSMMSTASSAGTGRRKLRRTRSRPDSDASRAPHPTSASRSRELSLQRSFSHL